MTSASELFYNRRSRFGRSSDPFDDGSDFGSQPHIDRTNRRHRHLNGPGGSHARRDRIDLEGCDPLRRAHHHPRQPPLHRPPHPAQERESIRLEDSVHQLSSGNVNYSGSHINVQDSLRVSANDRLPGAVLLARERLLQRLRGVTLSSARRNNRNSSGTSSSRPNSNPIREDFSLVDSAEWETEISREWLSTFAPLPNSTGQQKIKRPPGLTQKALNRLCIEIFSTNHEKSYRNIGECSICLESFSEGEKLVRLPCEHRYHFRCLEPWVRTCGDCPYCRRGIDVNSHDGEKNFEWRCGLVSDIKSAERVINHLLRMGEIASKSLLGTKANQREGYFDSNPYIFGQRRDSPKRSPDGLEQRISDISLF
ncbi:RING/U-box superfamily protein [Striga asiatica]|uniref:RING/U-box superfamily protein n=1 Tax=Striga asiatica TaxID=4170 RepID=A0A5A7PWJ5_STRAF|nr:RING/U-box superfamily protein [Striga asiatica]